MKDTEGGLFDLENWISTHTSGLVTFPVNFHHSIVAEKFVEIDLRYKNIQRNLLIKYLEYMQRTAKESCRFVSMEGDKNSIERAKREPEKRTNQVPIIYSVLN